MKILLTILALIGVIIGCVLALFVIGLIAMGCESLYKKYNWIYVTVRVIKKIFSVAGYVLLSVIGLAVVAVSFLLMYQELWGV